MIAKLTEQIAKLTERVAELLVVAQRRQRKPAPEKPPEPRPVVVGDAKQAFERRPKPPKKAAEHQRRRVVRRRTCRCRDYGARTTPRSLPAPYERSKGHE